jgi:hypothetical protein
MRCLVAGKHVDRRCLQANDACRGARCGAAWHPATFAFPPEELIRKAQQLHKDGSGVRQPELLADDFRFEFPIVSLSKKVLQASTVRAEVAKVKLCL